MSSISLPSVLRGIADQSREAVEHLTDGHHAARHDLFVQIRDEPRCLRERLVERGIARCSCATSVRRPRATSSSPARFVSPSRRRSSTRIVRGPRAASARAEPGIANSCVVRRDRELLRRCRDRELLRAAGIASSCVERRHGLGQRELAQARERGRGGLPRGAAGDLDLHRTLERIDCGEERIRHRAIDGDLRVAYAIEQRLQLVRERRHRRVAHRRAHSLHRVHRAKDCAHWLRRRGRTLQREQLLVHRGELLATLRLKERGVLGQVHGCRSRGLATARQPSTRCTASSTRLGWNGLTTKSFAPA